MIHIDNFVFCACGESQEVNRSLLYLPPAICVGNDKIIFIPVFKDNAFEDCRLGILKTCNCDPIIRFLEIVLNAESCAPIEIIARVIAIAYSRRYRNNSLILVVTKSHDNMDEFPRILNRSAIGWDRAAFVATCF